MKSKKITEGSDTRILRREDSLAARHYKGISIRVIYECDALEVLRTDMEPETLLDDRDIATFAVLHVVLGGSAVFHIASRTNSLMPGDSITPHKGQQCTVSNPTSSRSSILSFLIKSSSACRSADVFPRDMADGSA